MQQFRNAGRTICADIGGAQAIFRRDVANDCIRISSADDDDLIGLGFFIEKFHAIETLLDKIPFAPALTAAQIHAYWASGEPQGKAGAYAIQGLGAAFVAGISGSYTGVMGLPLFETAALLRAHGIPVWSGALI